MRICDYCNYLKRINVGYVSMRYECKLDKKLGIRCGYNKPHPKCPLKNTDKYKGDK